MTINPDRLDQLISKTEERIAPQTARMEAKRYKGLELIDAQRLLRVMEMDLAAFKNSRDAVAESHNLMNTHHR